MQSTDRPLRIAYLSGPNDIAKTYSEWLKGGPQDYFGTDYMKQFLQLSRDLGAKSYVIATLPGAYSITEQPGFVLENRPVANHLPGLRYHLGMVAWFARLALPLIRFRPDVMIVTILQNHWFLLFFLPWLGVKIVPSFHSVLWPQFRPRRVWKVLWQLNRILILRHVTRILVTSEPIRLQLRALIGERRLGRITVLRHFPTYSPSQFERIASSLGEVRPPFRVFFAGRIETNKGVYDLLDIATRLNAERPGQFRFDLCGDGGELEGLRRKVSTLGLEGSLVCHGYCGSDKLSSLLTQSHAVVVPTTTEFEEGYNMVCAEAILANRPLVTSAVCPAIEDVRQATLEARPDCVDDYRAAILSLSDDPCVYANKRRACDALHQLFYDQANSWYSKMRIALTART